MDPLSLVYSKLNNLKTTCKSFDSDTSEKFPLNNISKKGKFSIIEVFIFVGYSVA